MSQLVILGRERKTLEWKAEKPQSVKIAREAFENKLSEGYAAFRIFHASSQRLKAGTTMGEQLLEFDRDAETIQMTPPMVGG